MWKIPRDRDQGIGIWSPDLELCRRTLSQTDPGLPIFTLFLSGLKRQIQGIPSNRKLRPKNPNPGIILIPKWSQSVHFLTQKGKKRLNVCRIFVFKMLIFYIKRWTIFKVSSGRSCGAPSLSQRSGINSDATLNTL